MENILKPCPFCGNEATYREGHEHCYIGGYDINISIECTYCSAEMGSSYGTNAGKETTEQEAKDYLAECWNLRTLKTKNQYEKQG